LPTFSENLTLQEAFETTARYEEVKRTEFDRAFCKKNSNFQSIDFLHLLAKRKKSIGKMIYQKKLIGVIERPRSLNPDKAIAMAICPIIVHFITYRALDAWL